MNKTLLLVIVVLILIGGFVYFNINKPQIENIDNANGEIVNNQEEEIDTSDWVTFENNIVRYSIKYDGERFETKTDKYGSAKIVDILISKEKDKPALIFYSNLITSIATKGADFSSIKGYEKNDDKYYVFYGSEEYGYKKQNVEVLEKIDLKAGEIIIIDGNKFDYSGPSVGPGSDYAAVINLNNNSYSGIAVKPNDGIVGYDEFLEIMKSMKSI